MHYARVLAVSGSRALCQSERQRLQPAMSAQQGMRFELPTRFGVDEVLHPCSKRSAGGDHQPKLDLSRAPAELGIASPGVSPHALRVIASQSTPRCRRQR